MHTTKPTPLNGLAASTVHLPSGDWLTVLDCLCDRFPAVGRRQWHSRMTRGRVLDAAGAAVAPEQPYRPGMRIHYYREVAAEPAIPFTETLLHVDAHLVVVDKPHFLPVMPRGPYVEQTLAARVVRQLGNPELVPLHRLDRGTAGLVLFSANPASRDRYQALFRSRRIVKRYEALAANLPDAAFPLRRCTRLVPGEPFFRMREAAGTPNSETQIDRLGETQNDLWRYALTPVTGRKHQLRVHMAALGAAIANDPLYPTLTNPCDDDFSRPLKLLARSLEFVDPLSGKRRYFESRQTL